MSHFNPWEICSTTDTSHSCVKKILASPQAMEFLIDDSNSIVDETLKQSHSVKIISQLHRIDKLYEELLTIQYKLGVINSHRYRTHLSASSFENYSSVSEQFTDLLSALTEHRSLISTILHQETSDSDLSADPALHNNVMEYWRDMSKCVTLVSTLQPQLNRAKEISDSATLTTDIESITDCITTCIQSTRDSLHSLISIEFTY